jgi:hypothetical protein
VGQPTDDETNQPRSSGADGGDATAPREDTTRPGGDLRGLLRQFAQPVIDSLDGHLREQIDQRVDDRVDDRVAERVEAILADRLAVLERAVADLDRAVRALQARLDQG